MGHIELKVFRDVQADLLLGKQLEIVPVSQDFGQDWIPASRRHQPGVQRITRKVNSGSPDPNTELIYIPRV